MRRGALYWKAEAPNATFCSTPSGTRGRWVSYVAIAVAGRKSAKQHLILKNAQSATERWTQRQIRRLHAHNNNVEVKGRRHVGNAAYTHLITSTIISTHTNQKGPNR